MVRPPLGFIFLRDAADEIGRKIYGPAWQALADHSAETISGATDPMIGQVVTLLAEQCAQGDIAAAYRSILLGADTLDPAVWRMANWRAYSLTERSLWSCRWSITSRDQTRMVSPQDAIEKFLSIRRGSESLSPR
jgi:hypothetical protein